MGKFYNCTTINKSSLDTVYNRFNLFINVTYKVIDDNNEAMEIATYQNVKILVSFLNKELSNIYYDTKYNSLDFILKKLLEIENFFKKNLEDVNNFIIGVKKVNVHLENVQQEIRRRESEQKNLKYGLNRGCLDNQNRNSYSASNRVSFGIATEYDNVEKFTVLDLALLILLNFKLEVIKLKSDILLQSMDAEKCCSELNKIYKNYVNKIGETNE